MATWIWILIAIVVVIVVAAIVMAARRRRTAALRQRFGPEYDRTVESREGRRAAEADLHQREKERARFEVRPLPEGMRERFAAEWRHVQDRFVDQPSGAIVGADELVHRVMEARGYPMRNFEDQAGLISVDHPEVVENYRFAHDIHERAQVQQASTEDLREALLRYRSLFDELLRRDDGQPGAAAEEQGYGRGAAAEQDYGRIPGQARRADDPARPDTAGSPEPAARRDGIWASRRDGGW